VDKIGGQRRSPLFRLQDQAYLERDGVRAL
jgi:hypothetical protein